MSNTVLRVNVHGLLNIADRENEDSDEFRRFRRHLFQGSLARILHLVKPSMMDATVLRFADGHYRKVIFGLGPYIGDYPEQVQLSCIVQGWCPKYEKYLHTVIFINN